MRNIALTIAYDGTDWWGFQRQTSLPSIQAALEDGLSRVFQHPVTIVCAGRTDAGVHAVGQVVNFHTENPIPIERVAWVTNTVLPATIRVRAARDVAETFHARFSAAYRRYWYIVQCMGRPDPIAGRFRWLVGRQLDVMSMQAALTPLQGRHDFKAYCHRIEPEGSTERTIHHARVRPWRNGIILDVQANAFLHQMVRLLVANTVHIGMGLRPVNWLTELLRTQDRHVAGKVAPSCGLFLMRIGYPPTVNPRWGSLLEKLNNEELLG